jgi:hypothetical protein
MNAMDGYTPSSNGAEMPIVYFSILVPSFIVPVWERKAILKLQSVTYLREEIVAFLFVAPHSSNSLYRQRCLFAVFFGFLSFLICDFRYTGQDGIPVLNTLHRQTGTSVHVLKVLQL